MVYPIEKFSNIVASFSRFPMPPQKNAKNAIFLLCALKKSSERWFETHLMLNITQLTLDICFWKFILSFETCWYFLGFCHAYSNKEKKRARIAKEFSKNELKLIFASLNQEQMNKIRSPINIRDFTK